MEAMRRAGSRCEMNYPGMIYEGIRVIFYAQYIEG